VVRRRPRHPRFAHRSGIAAKSADKDARACRAARTIAKKGAKQRAFARLFEFVNTTGRAEKTAISICAHADVAAMAGELPIQ
jgi:hypothetical protein